MKIKPNKELEQFIDSLPIPSSPFRPYVYHNKAGDQLEVYLKDEPYYGKYLDGLVLHLSQDSNEIIGFTIEFISRYAEKV
jgi:hypothetical protein